ncbi:MAG: hypothetical protein FJX74_01445 [Armatimonadetes bacterium]|nr:hypothetical protein [Armatimonadota bacterium]
MDSRRFPSIADLKRRYLGAFRDLGRELDQLLRRDATGAGSPDWMGSQARSASKTYERALRTVLGPDGDGGIAAELVEAGLLSGKLLGHQAAEWAGFPTGPVDDDVPRPPAYTRLVQGVVSQTRQLLTTALADHREACERIRRASMSGWGHDAADQEDLVVIPFAWVDRVVYEAVHASYLDTLVACGVDVIYITGPAARCGTCAYARHQRLFSISGNDPTLPPLSSVTVYATPPLWHACCKHPGVPYSENGPLSLEELPEKLWEYGYELGIGALIFGKRHSGEREAGDVDGGEPEVRDGRP